MITFKYFGLQTIVENIVRTQEIRVFKRTMRQLVCQMDEWDGLTMEDIRRIEHETAARLEKEIKEGAIAKHVCWCKVSVRRSGGSARAAIYIRIVSGFMPRRWVSLSRLVR